MEYVSYFEEFRDATHFDTSSVLHTETETGVSIANVDHLAAMSLSRRISRQAAFAIINEAIGLCDGSNQW